MFLEEQLCTSLSQGLWEDNVFEDPNDSRIDSLRLGEQGILHADKKGVGSGVRRVTDPLQKILYTAVSSFIRKISPEAVL